MYADVSYLLLSKPHPVAKLLSRSIEIKPDDYVSLCDWGVALIERTHLVEGIRSLFLLPHLFVIILNLIPLLLLDPYLSPIDKDTEYSCKMAAQKFLQSLEINPHYLEGKILFSSVL